MAKLSEYSSVIKCFLSAILFINFTLAMQCETFALASANCTDASGIQMGICVDTHNDSLDILLQMQIANHSSTKQPGGSSLNSQRSRETAEGSASSDAQGAGVGQACDGVMRMYEKPDGTTDEIACLYFSAAHPAGSRPTLPTTREILYYAATTIHADGAGINKQPPTVSYTNRFVPTIVSVTSPTQTHVINLLGRDITITLTATNYEYSWGDGTPNTVTPSPGLARFDELRLRFDLPVLLSVSRKSFLRALTGRGPGDVGAATLAAELAAAAGGADFIRTHEPRPLRDGLAVLAALKETARIR